MAGRCSSRSQADDRQDDPAQIGETEQARRDQRHMGQIRQPDDFGDRGKPKPERFSGKLENQKVLGGGIVLRQQQARLRPQRRSAVLRAAAVG